MFINLHAIPDVIIEIHKERKKYRGDLVTSMLNYLIASQLHISLP